MAQTITQGNRIVQVTTPLGADVLVLSGFSGEEAISELFRVRLDLLATNENRSQVKFESLLGKQMTIKCSIYTGTTSAEYRYFDGIVSQFIEGHEDDDFTHYHAELVPKVWLLKRVKRSRIFQQKSVPDILKEVFTGYTMQYSIQGTFEKREYVVQYRESDFDFACRLMEEEGICYFFKHTESTHTMVLTNSSLNYADVPGVAQAKYKILSGQEQEAFQVYGWKKFQELRSGKTTLWDSKFQLPGKNLQGQKIATDSVVSGTVTHKLKTDVNASLELYDYPGGYAKRFDGINSSGGEQASELSKISQDNVRTADLRMGEDAARGLWIRGESNCINFISGFKFTLGDHFDADGAYVLSRVVHKAEIGTAYRSGEKSEFKYSNVFECFPTALTYRPPNVTPRPFVHGVQTAVVVGPSGEEIFTDKYGRIKVQFPWDRDGQNDANSSCWLRVATPWAGQQWGMISLPRIGQEVVVDFVEGDPDSPIVVGSVYNAQMMPPYTLPDNKTRSTIKSRSTLSGGAEDYNEIRFEDKKGSEQFFVRAQKDLDVRVKEESRLIVMKNEHQIVEIDRKVKIKGNEHCEITGNLNEKVDGSVSLNVTSSRDTKIGQKEAIDAGTEVHIKSGVKAIIEAGAALTVKVGSNYVGISPTGVTVSGAMITIKAGSSFIVLGPEGVTIQGPMVMINSGGAAVGDPAGSGSGASPTAPVAPDEADDGSMGTKKG